jgi:hypothetical protein
MTVLFGKQHKKILFLFLQFFKNNRHQNISTFFTFYI